MNTSLRTPTKSAPASIPQVQEYGSELARVLRAFCKTEQENDMEDAQVQIGKMEKQLQKWGAKLDELAAKAEAAGAEARADERRLIADLRAKQERVQAKLHELKAAGDDKWDAFKAGVESAYDELEGAFKKLKH